jgi:hypothetical protein
MHPVIWYWFVEVGEKERNPGPPLGGREPAQPLGSLCWDEANVDDYSFAADQIQSG